MDNLGIQVQCDCDDWKLSADQIFIAQIEATKEKLIKPYDGKRWAFCPWCGDELLEKVIIEKS